VDTLKRFIPEFADKRVVVLGDLMLDHYLLGGVERISPEAPVPVLSVQEERDAPGGAANVAACLHALGAGVIPCGLIGCDEDGVKLEEYFKAWGMDTRCLVKTPRRPTTKKTRVVAARQQIVRIDYEKKTPCDDALIRDLITAFDRAFFQDADGVIISDYGKGMLLPPLIEHAILRCREAGCLLAVDPKLAYFESYRGVGLITPNTKEAGEMAGFPIRDTASLLAAGAAIRAALDPEILLITQSERGIALFPRGQDRIEIPARAREVFDVTGAGDMVIAVAALALISGADALEAASLANIAAGLEVQKFGCQAITPAELISALDGSTNA
jgi:D-beta-D-heptose 7-phosphate kinase/D-beta-D-heptose 1-phosphate adenosyltransferase